MCDTDQHVCVAGVKTALGCQEAPDSDNDTVVLSFDIEFLTKPSNPKPTVVRVCGGPADFQCESPIGDPLSVVYGEVAAVTVPTGYQGVLEVKNPDALPALYYLGRPITDDTHGYDLTLATPSTAALLGLATGQDVDSKLGILVITTRDCARQPLSDVQVTSDFTGAIQFYFQDKTPLPSLMATNAEGAAGYANVAEGSLRVHRRHLERASTQRFDGLCPRRLGHLHGAVPVSSVPAPKQAPAVRLGRYRLLLELGQGGMARVFVAFSSGLGGFNKLVVLKVMRDELNESEGSLAMFLAEARLAARMNHQNIVQTLEVGEDGGRYFICMEYLEGQTLGRLMKKTIDSPLPLAARLELISQVLEALIYMHGFTDPDGTPLSLVHRDISPNNIFVTFDGVAKVLDFGVAKAVGVSHATEAGMFKGKLGYAAPEQILGNSEQRSDVFAIGVLLWELLAYRRLSQDRTQQEIVQARMAGRRSGDHAQSAGRAGRALADLHPGRREEGGGSLRVRARNARRAARLHPRQ